MIVDPGPAGVLPLAEHRGYFGRIGKYSTDELVIQPEAYDPELDVDFTLLREQDLIPAGLVLAA
ncbi:hypothetical protein [Streptomyces sp. RKAG290]|uniref:hypothetical protein n=1 Tax=Streptomyces sp. RKAG290 TaxID=2888348 RepID=UPI002033E83E|nr:hypothetical protein [Streptomyces sp. RKAG290]MCM2416387.1 hypothetical protein [Streptomyces sp. RKAG290]